MIDILAREGVVPDMTLCLVGTPGPADYYQHITERVRASGEWITVKENLSRADLLALIPTYRYEFTACWRSTLAWRRRRWPQPAASCSCRMTAGRLKL